jgi:hypothetical protein
MSCAWPKNGVSGWGEGLKNRFALMLLILALAVRMVIPTGWMPSTERSFEISICTGTNMAKVWIDTKGIIHKSDPSKHKSGHHEPCAFAGMAMAADFPAPIAALPMLSGAGHHLLIATLPASIGKGLAAPPPPSTGPPSFI